MNGMAARRASKRWLAEWLRGPYSAALRRGASRATRPSGTCRPSTNREPVRSADLLVTLDDAHRTTLVRLRELQGVPEPPQAYVRYALDSGLVARCQDARGGVGFVPVDHGGERLAHRLYVLVLVDYFTRPADYARELAICARCSTIEFCSLARDRGHCGFDSGSNAGFPAARVA
jgi:hypothetical protein